MTQDWTLEEALAYYRRQGAPGEQGALVQGPYHSPCP